MLLVNSKKGYYVKSYGTGSVVTLPGAAPEQPNVYSFDTTYEEMYQDLYQKDLHRYPPNPSVPDCPFLVEQWQPQGQKAIGNFKNMVFVCVDVEYYVAGC